jgi:hypothetical protein
MSRLKTLECYSKGNPDYRGEIIPWEYYRKLQTTYSPEIAEDCVDPMMNLIHDQQLDKLLCLD